MSLEWLVAPLGRDVHSGLSPSREDPNDGHLEMLFLLLHIYVGGAIICNHLKDTEVVWIGTRARISEGGLRCVTWNMRGLVGSPFSSQSSRERKHNYFRRLTRSNDITCLQEILGKDELLLALRVLAPRFQLFGTLKPNNAKAGGSAVCIQKDLFLDDAMVTHVVTCQGRDHIVNIRSGCRSRVVVNVHIEPELTLRSLRERQRLITPHWPHYP